MSTVMSASALGFVSVVPVKTWHICSALSQNECQGNRENSKGEREREVITHYTAVFYHAYVKGQKSVSSDQWGKSNTLVIWEFPPAELRGTDNKTALQRRILEMCCRNRFFFLLCLGSFICTVVLH